MKTTHIIRRVDDLGITIPRIIRQQLEIKYGDQFEFFIDDDGNIVLKKVVTE